MKVTGIWNVIRKFIDAETATDVFFALGPIECILRQRMSCILLKQVHVIIIITRLVDVRV